MPRACSVCSHPEVEQINAAILANEPYRSIANRFEVSNQSVGRHARGHLADAIAKAQEAARADGVEIVREREAGELRNALDIVAQLKQINEASLDILEEARGGDRKDNSLALRAIDRLHRQIELQAKLIGELDESAKVQVLSVTALVGEYLQQEGRGR